MTTRWSTFQKITRTWSIVSKKNYRFSLLQNKNEKFDSLRENLISTFNETKIPKFDISELQKEVTAMEEKDDWQYFLHSFFDYLYKQPIANIL